MADPIKTPAGNPSAPAPTADPAKQDPANVPAGQQPGTPTPAPEAKPTGDAGSPPTEDKQVPIAALHEEREKRQHLQAELEALKKIAGQNVLFDINGNPVQAPQQQQPQQTDQQKQIEELWQSDPRRAVQAELMLAFNWYDKLNAQVDMQEAQVESKYPDFNKYRPQVRQYVRQLPPEQRARDGVVELAYFAVRGQNVETYIAQKVEEERQRLIQKFQAGEAVQGLQPGAVSAPPVPQGAVTLTEEQKKVADAMGIPEAEYVKYIKK